MTMVWELDPRAVPILQSQQISASLRTASCYVVPGLGAGAPCSQEDCHPTPGLTHTHDQVSCTLEVMSPDLSTCMSVPSTVVQSPT